MLPWERRCPQPPVSAPGSGAPTSFPDARSQSRNFPSVLVVITCGAGRVERDAHHVAVLAAECAPDLPAGGGVPEVDVAGQVAGRDLLAVRRESGSRGCRSRGGSCARARAARVPDCDVSSEARRRDAVPSGLKSRSWSVPAPPAFPTSLPGAQVVDRAGCRRRRRSRRAGRPGENVTPAPPRGRRAEEPHDFRVATFQTTGGALPVAATRRPSWLNASESRWPNGPRSSPSTAWSRARQRVTADRRRRGHEERAVGADGDGSRRVVRRRVCAPSPAAGTGRSGTAARAAALRARPRRSRCRRSSRCTASCRRGLKTGPAAGSRVSHKRLAQRRVGHVPDADAAVVRGRREHLAVGAEGEREHAPRRPSAPSPARAGARSTSMTLPSSCPNARGLRAGESAGRARDMERAHRANVRASSRYDVVSPLVDEKEPTACVKPISRPPGIGRDRRMGARRRRRCETSTSGGRRDAPGDASPVTNVRPSGAKATSAVAAIASRRDDARPDGSACRTGRASRDRRRCRRRRASVRPG